MDRTEHVRVCKRCSNRKFDKHKGLICGLTDEVATFEVQCFSYVRDEKAIELEDKKDALNKSLYR